MTNISVPAKLDMAVSSWPFPGAGWKSVEPESTPYESLYRESDAIADRIYEVGDIRDLEARLVRHGKIGAKEQVDPSLSVLADNRFDNQIGLSDSGRADAAAAGDDLIKIYERTNRQPGQEKTVSNGQNMVRKVVIISSLLRRASETAHIITGILKDKYGDSVVYLTESWVLRERDTNSPYAADDGKSFKTLSKKVYNAFSERLLDIPSNDGGKPTEGLFSMRTRFSAGLFIEFVKYIQNENITDFESLKDLMKNSNFVIVGHGKIMSTLFDDRVLSSTRLQRREDRIRTSWLDNSKFLNGYPEYISNPFYYAYRECVTILQDREALSKLVQEPGSIAGKSLLDEMIEGLEFVRAIAQSKKSNYSVQ